MNGAQRAEAPQSAPAAVPAADTVPAPAAGGNAAVAAPATPKKAKKKKRKKKEAGAKAGAGDAAQGTGHGGSPGTGGSSTVPGSPGNASAGTQNLRNMQEFWQMLTDDERAALARVQKDELPKRMKEQQKYTCTCNVCIRRRLVVEDELNSLYEQFIVDMDRAQGAAGALPSGGAAVGAEFSFARCLGVEKDYLVLTEYVLRDGGAHLIRMFEVLGQRREDITSRDDLSDIDAGEAMGDVDRDDSEADDEDLSLSERIVQGKHFFSLFGAKMFEQQIATAYKEKVALEKQRRLIEEEEREDQAQKEKLLKKEADKEKRRQKRARQKKNQQEEKRRVEELRLKEEEARAKEVAAQEELAREQERARIVEQRRQEAQRMKEKQAQEKQAREAREAKDARAKEAKLLREKEEQLSQAIAKAKAKEKATTEHEAAQAKERAARDKEPAAKAARPKDGKDKRGASKKDAQQKAKSSGQQAQRVKSGGGGKASPKSRRPNNGGASPQGARRGPAKPTNGAQSDKALGPKQQGRAKASPKSKQGASQQARRAQPHHQPSPPNPAKGAVAGAAAGLPPSPSLQHGSPMMGGHHPPDYARLLHAHGARGNHDAAIPQHSGYSHTPSPPYQPHAVDPRVQPLPLQQQLGHGHSRSPATSGSMPGHTGRGPFAPPFDQRQQSTISASNDDRFFNSAMFAGGGDRPAGAGSIAAGIRTDSQDAPVSAAAAPRPVGAIGAIGSGRRREPNPAAVGMSSSLPGMATIGMLGNQLGGHWAPPTIPQASLQMGVGNVWTQPDNGVMLLNSVGPLVPPTHSRSLSFTPGLALRLILLARGGL